MWTEGHNQLESFGFWRRKFCIKNVEILSVGKIAEFAKFAGEKDESLQTVVCLIERSELWMEEDWRSDGVQRSATEAE